MPSCILWAYFSFADAVLSFSGVTFIFPLFCYVSFSYFCFHVGSAALRPIVLRYSCASTATCIYLATLCVLFGLLLCRLFGYIAYSEYCLPFISVRRSTVGESGDTTVPSPGRSPKESLWGVGLNDPLHGRQACPEINSFRQGVGQICPRDGQFSRIPSQNGDKFVTSPPC